MGILGFFGGAIGFMVSGSPLGALLGYVLGSLFDSKTSLLDETDRRVHNEYFSHNEAGSNTRRYSRSNGESNVARDNFVFSLLVLSAGVIKADGKIMHSEMEYVRRFFRSTFGEMAAQQANDILLEIFKHPIDIDGCGRQIADNFDYATRLQLLHYLVGIAKADGHIDPTETATLRLIARAMLMDANEVDSLLGLGRNDLESAYKVLEISPDVSDEELKRAYKKLVLKHHPDRVATLGEDIRQNAEEKLKQINEAYERVCKARAMN